MLARYDVGPHALIRIVQDRDWWNLALTRARAHVEEQKPAWRYGEEEEF